MKKGTSKFQYIFSDSCMKKSITGKIIRESESGFDSDGELHTYFCKDMIISDAPDDPYLEVEEVYAGPLSRIHFPIELNKEDVDMLKTSGSKYRFFLYYVNPVIQTKWYEAFDFISSEKDFNEYIDPQSDVWKAYSYSFDEDFVRKFKTYDQWKTYLKDSSIQQLKDILSQSNRAPYKYMTRYIKTNDDGIAYVIIAWRA